MNNTNGMMTTMAMTTNKNIVNGFMIEQFIHRGVNLGLQCIGVGISGGLHLVTAIGGAMIVYGYDVRTNRRLISYSATTAPDRTLLSDTTGTTTLDHISDSHRSSKSSSSLSLISKLTSPKTYRWIFQNSSGFIIQLVGIGLVIATWKLKSTPSSILSSSLLTSKADSGSSNSGNNGTSPMDIIRRHMTGPRHPPVGSSGGGGQSSNGDSVGSITVAMDVTPILSAAISTVVGHSFQMVVDLWNIAMDTNYDHDNNNVSNTGGGTGSGHHVGQQE